MVRRLFPDFEAEYEGCGWKMFKTFDRTYDNSKARRDLGWQPRGDFRFVLDRPKHNEDPRSELARAVGSKGYHRTPQDKV